MINPMLIDRKYPSIYKISNQNIQVFNQFGKITIIEHKNLVDSLDII
uniref:Uncharacterized protein n=1 Tax=Lepeophtheirus salmonis TaxID=72036 RepID=A0A0K2ULW9_LEPSM